MTPPSSLPTASPSACISPEANQADWFSREIYRHEPQLKSYLRGSFPRIRDVDDVVQESYLRMWRRQSEQPIRFAKAFLFTVAKRLALDWIRREKNAGTEQCEDLAVLAVYDEGRSAVDEVNRAELVELLIDAVDSLPRRCREVVILRKFQLLSAREAAERLGVQEHTIEVQLVRANARIRAHLAARGVTSVLGRES